MRRLRELGADVRGLDPAATDPAIRRATIAEAADEVVAGARVVFHLAARNGHRASMEDTLADYEHGAEASVRLLGPARIVFTSTRQLYGTPRRLPVRETDPLDPPDAHCVHKEMVEHVVRRNPGGHAILRLTNCYGPGMALDGPSAGFAGHAVGRALRGDATRILGDGKLLRDFNYVDDVVEALVRTGHPEAKSGTWNLGAEPVTLLVFAYEVWNALGRLPQIEFAALPPELREIAVGSVHSDWSRIEADFGWRPRVGLREGLERTVRYVRL